MTDEGQPAGRSARRHPPGRPAGSGKRPPRRSGPAGSGRRRAEATSADRAILYGWHPVVEALRNPLRRPLRLVLTENAARRLAEEGVTLPLEPDLVSPDALSRLLEPDAVHQGLYLEAEHLPEPTLDTLPADALLVALDQVTDPHHVGAIVRSAAAFGAAAVITTIRHSPEATGVLAKAASGGLEHAPFLHVRNLAEALLTLRERGYSLVGLDSAGAVLLRSAPTGRPLVLVLGAEGRGLRQRTRDICDIVARLEMPGAITSLNVSNAAAIALYALSGDTAA